MNHCKGSRGSREAIGKGKVSELADTTLNLALSPSQPAPFTDEETEVPREG